MQGNQALSKFKKYGMQNNFNTLLSTLCIIFLSINKQEILKEVKSMEQILTTV